MSAEVDLPSSIVLLLLRIDRRKLASSATPLGISVSQARRRFSGVGLPWYHLEGNGIRLRLNGVIALADGVRAHELGDPSADAWTELGNRWPLITHAKSQMLARLTLTTKAGLEALEYYAGAVELLDRLMTFVLSRPGATAREIAACERWLHGRFTQYLTGRGALRNVVLPWRTWLERYEYILRSLEGELEELELPPEGPLLELSSGLKLITTGRDRKSIVREYRIRLGDLTDACNRVAAEIGVIGTFGSLALVPFESALGFLFLGPVVIAGLAYYGGHSLARATVMRWRRRRAAPLGSDRHINSPVQPEPPSLADTLRQLTERPVHIVASSRLSAADVACALEIRHQLLERTTCVDPLKSITIAANDDCDKGMRVVLGGPLVRTTLEPFVALECDITDSRGNGWEVVAGDQSIVHCDDDETVGCCAVGSDARTLFVFGVRDSGTVIATQWLAHALDNADIGHGANWVALRRGKNNHPEEFARG